MDDNQTVKPPSPLKVPVLLLIFNRPDTTRLVFEAIKQAKPEKLYIAGDGPRLNVTGETENCRRTRKIADSVTWDCEIKTLFQAKNLGCKHGVSSGIDWFFKCEEMGIVLEDDTVPSQSFFWFCQELLEKYKNDQRIMHINGTNFFWNKIQHSNASYFFSQYGNIWGWASWRRAWKLYDVNTKDWDYLKKTYLKKVFSTKNERTVREQQIEKILSGQLDTWDYQWILYKHVNAGLSIIPNSNLVKNIGFIQNSTHTKKNEKDIRSNLPIQDIALPVKHPQYVFSDIEYDAMMRKRILKNFHRKKIVRRIRQLI